jgi:hypothetical protein
MFKLEDIKVGDTVTVASWMGGEFDAVVTCLVPDLKGRPGLDIRVPDQDEPDRWCYLSQVRAVYA